MIFIIYEKKWVCNRIIEEWMKYNSDKYTIDIKKASKIWLFNHFLYKEIPQNNNLPIITTIHHIYEEKFDKEEFKKIDSITSYYHSICSKTTNILKKYTEKKIIELILPISTDDYYFMSNKNELRKKWGFKDEFLIGSFQRDTEKDGKPKLEKGPDIFVKVLKYFKNPYVILTGYNRQYIIDELKRKNINFFYKENITQQEILELYNILDLYCISSRVEGGPRSLFEASLCKTAIISTDVGSVDKILSKKCIYDKENLGGIKKLELDVNTQYKNVLMYSYMVYGLEFYIKLFQ